MEDKTNNNFGNLCAMLGGALLGVAIIEQATKAIVPQMQKITSGDISEGLKLLSSGEKMQPEDQEKRREKMPEKEYMPSKNEAREERREHTC